jgi:amino acid transporter
MPKEQVSPSGSAGDAVIRQKVGIGWLAPIAAGLVTRTRSAAPALLAATARAVVAVSIVCPVFGDLHPTWRTPHVALLVQAAIAAVRVVGWPAPARRHDAVSMGIIAYLSCSCSCSRDDLAARAGGAW